MKRCDKNRPSCGSYAHGMCVEYKDCAGTGLEHGDLVFILRKGSSNINAMTETIEYCKAGKLTDDYYYED